MEIPRFDNAHILTIGDAMLDRYWHGDTHRVSAEAPIPVIEVNGIEDRPGGAANVALNVATLGAASTLIAATGQDEMSDILESKLSSLGIDCHFIKVEGMSTITKVRLVSRSQQMIRADFEALFDIDADKVVTGMDSIPEYDSVVLSDYDKGLFSDPLRIIENA